ncbi:MAG: M20/M25/M40 family metallo-hydrolase [Polyangiaceae bacterium]
MSRLAGAAPLLFFLVPCSCGSSASIGPDPATARAAPPVSPPSAPRPPAADVALARGILKELVEIDSVHANGSTGAAKAVAARLLAAGFPPADVQVLAPADHPTKGNVVVRFHGRGLGEPVLFIGHLDVVEAKREDWTYDPFRLTEKDGWFYGRGTMDMKGQATAMIVSLIRMRREGFVPDRDVVVALTADEEAGGDANGIEWLLRAHRDLVAASLVINTDAGEAARRGDHRLYFGMQTSEKKYVTFEIELTDKGGHSSRPTPQNPIFRLSKDLARLADYRFPLHLTDTTRLYFQRRAALEHGQTQADMLAVAGASPDPAAIDRLSQSTETNIILRTTCTATMIEGGHAENALPQRARATIQCRVMPGETAASVRGELLATMGDPTLVIRTIESDDESPESPATPRAVAALERVVKGMWPDVPVIPFMATYSSDSVHTRGAGLPTYGIDGMFDDLDDVRAHGKDERIGVAIFEEEVEFMYRLMKAFSVR